jgi:hypothetical protein
MNRRLSTSLFLLALAVPLTACSTVRTVFGKAEQVAAANEQGKLISPNAPTEGQTELAQTASSKVEGATVADIGRAAKSLPGGLIGDTANVVHIGDAIPPK